MARGEHEAVILSVINKIVKAKCFWDGILLKAKKKENGTR
jgi:hypothetical protein